MVKDGEDHQGLQGLANDELEKFRLIFSRYRNRDVAPLQSRQVKRTPLDYINELII